MNRDNLVHTFGPGVAEAVTQSIDPPQLTTREGWNQTASRQLAAPKRADWAPKGTKVGPRDPRLMYHAEMLPVATPALWRGLLDARRQLRKNRFRSVGRATDMIIDGDRGTGKSTLLVQIGRGFQGLIESDLGPDPNRIPVIYITVPPERESNLHWSLPFAEFLGLNHTLHPDDRNRRTADMTESVAHVMRQAKTRLVLIDGINRIQDNEIAAAFSYFEALQDRTNTTLVFCGTGAREIVHEARYDKRRKNLPDAVKGKTYFSDLPVLWAGTIPYGEDWHSVVQGFDEDLCLYDHKPHSLLKLSRYLHQRTGGYIASLSDLICQAAQEAIETATDTTPEAITRRLLDDIRIGRSDSR
ncbi:AAA family ATPase [Streptomyces sp. st140]|uniref:AAA family ATPase n=1 Tax=Streptomyces sp. st140 TaxID=1828052 RepID=UPI000BEF3BA3|nr:AAA family ATPase [Streptomyces sp. st140]